MKPRNESILLRDKTEIVLHHWPEPEQIQGDAFVLHGMGEHGLRYGELASSLGALGLACHGWTMRGHGASQGPRGDLVSVATVLEDLREAFAACQLDPERRFVLLVGHSIGGHFVLRAMTGDQPFASAGVALSPFLAPGPKLARWKVALSPWLGLLLPRLGIPNDVDPADISRDPEEVRLYDEDPAIHDRISARFGRDVLRSGATLLARPPVLHAPLLLLHGSGDATAPLAPARRFASLAGKLCQFDVIEGGYHDLNHDFSGAETRRRIAEWTRGQMEARKNA